MAQDVPPRRAIHLRALESSFVVEVRGSRSEELAAALRTAWSRCLDPGEPGDDAQVLRVVTGASPQESHLAQVAGDLVGEPEHLMPVLTTLVTRAAIDARAGTMLMFHAGAVADHRTGRAAVLVGASGAGKTTAVRHLARDLAYLTDEAVALDGTRVLTYPKPLSLVVGPGMPKQQVSPDELGLGASRQGCELGAIVLLARGSGVREPWLEPVPTLESLAALAEQSSYLARNPRPLQQLAGLAQGVGGVVRLHYGEADQLGPVVRDLVGAG